MCGVLKSCCNLQSQASFFWAMSKMGLRPGEALLDKASLILQQKELRAQVVVHFSSCSSSVDASGLGLLSCEGH